MSTCTWKKTCLWDGHLLRRCGLLLGHLSLVTGSALTAPRQARPHKLAAHQQSCGMYPWASQPMNAGPCHMALLRRYQRPPGPCAAINNTFWPSTSTWLKRRLLEACHFLRSAHVACKAAKSAHMSGLAEAVGTTGPTAGGWEASAPGRLKASATTLTRPGTCLTSAVYSAT